LQTQACDVIKHDQVEGSEAKFRDGKIVRSEEPLNLEMRFETLEGFITPTKSFYVRTHFPTPKIDRDAWTLSFKGEVEK
jgi:DMSO/TMAO reductase YedYZ molybdopterin-dependent catalytic subunit